MRIEPFNPSHLVGFRVQPEQANELALQPEAPASYRDGWTVFFGERPVAIGGLVPMWPGKAYAWALLSVDAGRHMVALSRLARFTLDTAPFERIEMYVAAEFLAAFRWARMLGFQCETNRMRKYLPDGGDAYLFARVK